MIKTIKKWAGTALLALACVPMCTTVVYAQYSASVNSNTVFPAQTFTATSQTGTVIQLGLPSGAGGSYSVGNISVTGTALTTATFTVMGSSDGGKTYYALPVNAVGTPTTLVTTFTATASGMYQVNLAGVTQVKLVTSGTFTATSVSVTLTAAPLGIIARAGGGSGGGSVSSVSNSDGTLTIGPTTGSVVASLALGHANTWTAIQTFSANSLMSGISVPNGTSPTTNINSGVFQNASTTPYSWAASNANDVEDTALCRASAGVVEVASGAACNASGTLIVAALTATTSVQAPLYKTTTTCGAVGTAANPSLVACAAAAAGVFSCAVTASAGTCVVSDTAVTANSSITVTPIAYANARLAVTCNTAPTSTASSVVPIAAIAAGTSFTINVPTITTNPACYSFQIIN